jgi:hypothetical protein
VYLLALLVYSLVERHVRTSLAARGDTLPDRPAPSQRPTARSVLHLMRNIAGSGWSGQDAPIAR